jgi:hypothetical protein
MPVEAMALNGNIPAFSLVVDAEERNQEALVKLVIPLSLDSPGNLDCIHITHVYGQNTNTHTYTHTHTHIHTHAIA